VEFRVRGGEIYFARVRTALKCIRNGRHSRRRFGQNLGFADMRGGRFRISSETEEPGYREESLLVGGVHPGEITGRFWYQRSYDAGHNSVCQTGSYQSPPVKHYGRDSLRFHASRRPL
jgi:hypothetical protein